MTNFQFLYFVLMHMYSNQVFWKSAVCLFLVMELDEMLDRRFVDSKVSVAWERWNEGVYDVNSLLVPGRAMWYNSELCALCNGRPTSRLILIHYFQFFFIPTSSSFNFVRLIWHWLVPQLLKINFKMGCQMLSLIYQMLESKYGSLPVTSKVSNFFMFIFLLEKEYNFLECVLTPMQVNDP